jgi:O-antigen/teichoic acid export membrane protein
MKTKLGRNLSFNALQLILNQLFGLVIFYLLSAGLDKDAFGHLNLALAVLLAVFNILSLGIDQLIIKKIASGAAVAATLSLYICHVLTAGLSFYGLLLGARYFFPAAETYDLILLIGIGKLFMFFSAPFKQVASGMERFRLLGYMSVVSNMVRCACLLVVALLHTLSVKIIIFIFIGGDLGELLVCIYLFKQAIKVPIAIRWNRPGYLKLLRESLPQTGVVVITSALARFDWIFIGFILSAVKLAEYSFAYKVFEIATFPMLAIAPLLIPLFTKLFQQQNAGTENLKFLIRIELVIAAFTALLLNVCWAPVIDWVTAGKYGMVNEKTIFILSLCMPLLYINNFLWTINFARGRFKMILSSFIVTLLVNVAADLLLIPFYQNEGAAIAFLLSCLAQTIYYLRMNTAPDLHAIWQALISCTGCAFVSGMTVRIFVPDIWLALPCAAILYVILLFITAQLQVSDGKNFQKLLNW